MKITDKKTARVYLRISQLRAGDEGDSPEAHLEEAKRWCARNDHYLDESASQMHADLDVSGFYKAWDERPGCVAHYQAAKRGEYDTLLVFKYDRFGRDQADSLYGLKQFMKTGVDVRSLVEQVDPSTDEGFIMRSVLTMVAEMESRNTSKRVLASVEHRAKHLKRHHGGRAPMWLIRTGKGQFEVIDDMANCIRYMVSLRLRRPKLRGDRTYNERCGLANGLWSSLAQIGRRQILDAVLDSFDVRHCLHSTRGPLQN